MERHKTRREHVNNSNKKRNLDLSEVRSGKKNYKKEEGYHQKVNETNKINA